MPVNRNTFFLVRWQDTDGEERVMALPFHTLSHLYSKGILPEDARTVEAAHPEALRMDGVFYGGALNPLKDLMEDSGPKEREWGLVDHTNQVVLKTLAQDKGSAEIQLMERFPTSSLPPMWRVLELEVGELAPCG